MIDSQGHLRCDNCGKEVALKLEGRLEWYCSRCRFYNREDSQVVAVDKIKKAVIVLKHEVVT